MSVRDRISPYNIDTISSKQVMRMKMYGRQKGELLMRSWESKDEYTGDWCYYL